LNTAIKLTAPLLTSSPPPLSPRERRKKEKEKEKKKAISSNARSTLLVPEY